MNFFEKNKRLIIRICLIILFTGIILVITKLTYQFSSITSATTSAFCFLIAVLFSAYFGDIIIAIVTSLIATICFDYFYLPPVGKFTIAAFPDAIALTTFLITAVLTSRLTSAAALNAKNTRYFEQTSTDLNELALWLIQTSKEQLTLSEIARQILHTFAASGFLVGSPKMLCSRR